MLTVSVVIETVNLELGPKINLPAVLAALTRQTYQGNIEVIVVVDADNHALGDYVRDRYPSVHLLRTSESTYYAMKNAGVRVATGDVVAILDSDCTPCPEWAERIASQVDGGADAVAGKTRYPAGESLSTLFNFFNFGYVQGDERGVANSLLPNNAAFKRELLLENPYESRLRRSGASYLLCRTLKAQGCRVVYEPKALVTHNRYGLGEEMLMRIKAGYDTVNLRAYDTERVLPEARYTRVGAPGLLVVCANRILFDIRAALGNRQDLGLPVLMVPVILIASPPIRVLEMVCGWITLFRPRFFQDRYGW